MWRLANYFYRTIRNVTIDPWTQSQDIPVSIQTNLTKDEDKEQDIVNEYKSTIEQIIKTNQKSTENIEKFHDYLHRISSSVVLTNEINIEEEGEEEPTLDSFLQADQACMNSLKNLSNLTEETMSIINNRLAIDAFEANDTQLGFETLEKSAKNGKNPAALYNLGLCYEQGLGVEPDRVKARDYFRQATRLNRINTKFSLFCDNYSSNITKTVTCLS